MQANNFNETFNNQHSTFNAQGTYVLGVSWMFGVER
jgi:hypothetical protein